MFTALADILGQNQSLDLSISAPDANGQMKVIVKPKLIKGQNTALAQPLALVATPQELDTDFIGALSQYSTERTSLAKQVEVTTTILAEAKKNEVGKATKAMKSEAKPAAPTAAAKEDDNEDDDDEGILSPAPAAQGTSTEPAPVAQPAPAPAASSNDDLLAQLM